MRCHCSIVCLLVLISLGAECCLFPGGIGPKDQPHVTCVAGDDFSGETSDTDEGRDLPACDSWASMLPHARCLLVQTDMILSRKSMDTQRLLLSSGARRHRRLCVERC